MAGQGEGIDLTEKDRPPAAEQVEKLHINADTDARKESAHHTIGVQETQASAGNHTHRGGDSVQLLAGLTIVGSRASDSWRLSVNQILVALGATDSSTP